VENLPSPTPEKVTVILVAGGKQATIRLPVTASPNEILPRLLSRLGLSAMLEHEIPAHYRWLLRTEVGDQEVDGTISLQSLGVGDGTTLILAQISR